jgi:hypothetical protein
MQVFIENIAGSKIKRKYDEENFHLIDSAIINGKFPYPFGFIAQTTTITRNCISCFIITKSKIMDCTLHECYSVGIINDHLNAKEYQIVLANRVDEEYKISTLVKKEIQRYITDLFRVHDDIEIIFSMIGSRSDAEQVVKGRLLGE